jgi:uncharacterized OsmC-like protein
MTEPDPDIARCLERVAQIVRQRPGAARHADRPARARWAGGLRTVARDGAGSEVVTDLPPELGGQGTAPSPGWYLRAALASCAVTRIAMAAATAGISLDRLDVEATSQSDLRGLLGVPDPQGHPVPVGPDDVRLQVRLSAAGVEPARLEALAREAAGVSPVAAALRQVVPVQLSVVVDVAPDDAPAPGRTISDGGRVHDDPPTLDAAR